jgi:hypothetical protein
MNSQQATTLLNQIGRTMVLVMSGGRTHLNAVGSLVLKVSHGYSVEIDYNEGSDTYTVRRVFTRGIKRWIKGEISNVYCDQVGEIAYRASCFDDDFGAVTA